MKNYQMSITHLAQLLCVFDYIHLKTFLLKNIACKKLDKS